MLQLTTIRNSQVLNRASNRNVEIFRNRTRNDSWTTSIASVVDPVIRYAIE